jgi:hypothetical protein
MTETAAERSERIMGAGAETSGQGTHGDHGENDRAHAESGAHEGQEQGTHGGPEGSSHVPGGGLSEADELEAAHNVMQDEADPELEGEGEDAVLEEEAEEEGIDPELLAARNPHVNLDEGHEHDHEQEVEEELEEENDEVEEEEEEEEEGDDEGEDDGPEMRHHGHHPMVTVMHGPRDFARQSRAASNLYMRARRGDHKAKNIIKHLGQAMKMGVASARNAIAHLFHIHSKTQPKHPYHASARALYVTVMTGQPNAAVSLARAHTLACQGNQAARAFVEQFKKIHAEEDANRKREAAERLYARLRRDDGGAWHSVAIVMQLRAKGNAQAASTFELLRKVHFDTQIARKEWEHARLADSFYARLRLNDHHAWAHVAMIYKMSKQGHPVATEAKNAIVEAQARANGEAPKLPAVAPAVAVTSLPPIVEVTGPAKPQVQVMNGPAKPQVTVSGAPAAQAAGCGCAPATAPHAMAGSTSYDLHQAAHAARWT